MVGSVERRSLVSGAGEAQTATCIAEPEYSEAASYRKRPAYQSRRKAVYVGPLEASLRSNPEQHELRAKATSLDRMLQLWADATDANAPGSFDRHWSGDGSLLLAADDAF